LNTILVDIILFTCSTLSLETNNISLEFGLKLRRAGRNEILLRTYDSLIIINSEECFLSLIVHNNPVVEKSPVVVRSTYPLLASCNDSFLCNNTKVDQQALKILLINFS
jgi:hypothetical protein